MTRGKPDANFGAGTMDHRRRGDLVDRLALIPAIHGFIVKDLLYIEWEWFHVSAGRDLAFAYP